LPDCKNKSLFTNEENASPRKISFSKDCKFRNLSKLTKVKGGGGKNKDKTARRPSGNMYF
jgi:hypothetical protein